MNKIKLKKPALHMDKKTIKEGIQFARAIVKDMTGNTNFPNPIPSLSSIVTAANDADAADVAAQNRAAGLATVKHEKYAVLKELLQKLAEYVQNIANATPAQAESIIQSAGIMVRKTGSRKPRVLAVVSTGKGEVTLTTPTLRNNNYRWEFASGDPAIEANWKLFIEARQSKVTQSGLTSGTTYHFRVWPISKTGVGQVSQVVSTVVL